MIKCPRKNVPDVGIELGAVCMPSGHASELPRPAYEKCNVHVCTHIQAAICETNGLQTRVNRLKM